MISIAIVLHNGAELTNRFLQWWLAPPTRRTIVVAALVCLAGFSLEAQDVHIRVLDGRNGQPVAKEHVQIILDNAPKGTRALDLPTDKDGNAVLHFDGKAVSFEIEADYYIDCRPFQRNAPRPFYSVDRVLSFGMATDNNCGKFRKSPQPGEIVFFVRPARWWERFQR